MFQRSLKAAHGMNAEMLQQMVDAMPVAVMICDLDEFKITYMNEASRTALTQLQDILPVPADQLVGQSIDIFHKNPTMQRNLLADPSNLPHSATIQLADQYLDLQISAIKDGRGKYVAPMLTWSIATERVKQEAEAKRLLTMIDKMPINVMMANTDLEIVYANDTTIETLTSLEHLLPIKAKDLVGSNIDIFHKHPEHQRKMLADPGNLPHKAKIKLGDETLELNVSAIMDEKSGEYLGPMVAWSVASDRAQMEEFGNSVSHTADAVASAATELQASSGAMTGSSNMATDRASTVAAAAEQLSASINEISARVQESAEIAVSAENEAMRSSEMITELDEAAQKIGQVVTIIQDIASQTNLLALNATIEAARAGEAGKGFAVVASEVKTLANQTASATEEISEQITAIQASTKSSVDAIGSIAETIKKINEIASTIAAAVEEQHGATQEVSANIQSVSEATNESSSVAGDVEAAASELSQQAESLRGNVEDFLVMVKDM